MNTKTNSSFLTRTATLARAAGARVALTLLLLLVTTAPAWAEPDLIIRSEADWNTFAANVANATNDYNGKTVVLAADISVSTMAGADNYNFFRGTFDGCGHTLTINLTGGYSGTAPFRRIENATIKNLNVAGTITTNSGMAGSIAFVTNGITHITNCLSTVTITGNSSGTDGGLVSCNNNELYFTNCAFKGELLGTDVGFGGFVGWNNVRVVYNHCLFAPSQVTMSTNGSSTFTREASNSTSNYNNSCFYTQSFGIVQGTYTNATGSDLQALLGDGWEVSGNDVVPKMVNSLEVTDVPYRAYNTVTKTYETLTAASCEIVTKATTTMGAAGSESWYVVSSNATVSSSRIEVLGTVNLILADSKSMRAEKGIHVPSGGTLNIYDQSGGTGQLHAFSNTEYAAGIGGNDRETNGTITIHGGSIETWGDFRSPGIGSGYGANGGTTIIYGGSITSTGGYYAAGIGGGNGVDNNAGIITIAGGSVTAQGGEYGAGIGGGAQASGGTITISGGTVIAKAKYVAGDFEDNSQAIGNGAGATHDCTLYIGDMKVYSSANASNPVAPANRESICQSKYAKLIPCTTHNYVNGECTYCGGVPNVPVTYLAYHTATQSFVEQSVDDPLTVNQHITTMGADDTETWYAVRKNVTFSNRIEVRGTVHLILCDGKTLTASKGITINNGNSLTIYGQTAGTGALNATGSQMGGGGTESAPIGSTNETTMGSIAIHGGLITANSIGWTAGIGGGIRAGGGSIAIYGGIINATGSYGNSEAIGHGADGANVSRDLADGLRVTTNNNSTPVAYSNRVSGLSQKIARVEPCTEHYTTTDHCDYCGLTCYRVFYDSNNATSGTVPAPNTAYRPGATVTVLGNTGILERTGYIFTGWNTAANGSGTTYTAGATFTINGTTTLYAKWTPITYTVRFHKNHDDAIGIMSDQTFTYDVSQTLVANAIIRDGYDFVGWSTTTDGVVAYTDGQSVSNLATVQGTVVNLYAQWTEIYSITYDLDGGSVAAPNPTTYTMLSDAITLTNPTRMGYTFAGWTGTELYEPTITVTIPTGSTGNREYTASWIITSITLGNNTDNSAIIAEANGKSLESVTLADRTLYRDGDWNTLCLPFDVDDFSGTPLERFKVKTLESTTYSDGTLTMNFADASTIEAGKPYIVKYEDADLVISSTADWNAFANNVSNGTTYQGKIVKLAADITISTMVGKTNSAPFKGTFDGYGHTLTFNYSSNISNLGVFRYIEDATIRNLFVNGSITSISQYVSGLAGQSKGTVTISNCVVSVTITNNRSSNNASYDGGFVGELIRGSVTFNNCAFKGKLLGSKSYANGGFVGYKYMNNCSAVFNNCLFDPTEVTMSPNSSGPFISNGGTYINCYYRTAYGSAQGTSTNNTGTALKNQLGDGWEVRDGNVVPKVEITVSNVVNPVFTNVTISNTPAATETVGSEYVDFVGTYSPVVIYESGDKHNLYLGSGNDIYYPTRTGYKVNACRAYFVLKNNLTAGTPNAEVRAFVLNFGEDSETGETTSLNDKVQMINDKEADAWYDLSGRKLSGVGAGPVPARLPKGVYINNGRKVVIK